MIRQILVFITLLLVAVGSGAAPGNRASIERAVAALIEQYGDGIAYAYPDGPVDIHYGKIFDGKSDDAVAFFGLEGFGGSNDSAEYMAVFAAVFPIEIAGEVSRPYRLVAVKKIGERGWREFDWKSVDIKHEAITLAGKKMGPRDALCCPSVPIKVTFGVYDGGESLVEIKGPRTRHPGGGHP